MKPPVTAKGLVEFASAMGADVFEKSRMVKPLWHAVRRNGEHGVIMPPEFEDGDHKDIVAAGMRKVFEEWDVVAYVFMCESWFMDGIHSDDLTGNLAGVLRGGSIREHPQRQECIWYTAEDEKGTISAFQKIERPEGEAPWLHPLKWMDKCGRMEGRFVGMLPTKGKGH